MKKNLKHILTFAFIIALVIGPALRTSADLDIIGIAETVGHAYFGETTVTPSYCLNTWDFYGHYTDPYGNYSKVREMVRYNQPTATYIYWTSLEPWPNGAPITGTGSFMTPISIWNYSCFDTNTYITTTDVQSYTVLLTCSVVSSGWSPPTGPFTCSLKTVGTALPRTCSSTNFGWTREFRDEYQVMPYGFVTGRVGFPNFSLAWPFQCYAGSAYLY